MSYRRGTLVSTSPYLLVQASAPEAVASVSTIDGKGRVEMTHEMVELLEKHQVPKPLDQVAQEYGAHDETLRYALEKGLLVTDLDAHKDSVFMQFERHFDRQRPKVGYIETTTRCPYTCVMCPKSSPAYDRPDDVMSDDLFRTIVDQLKYQSSVCLHLFGDPLMDPRIISRIEWVHKRGMSATFSTNPVLLTPSIVEELIAVGLDRIVVSCDATSSETYRGMRGPRANQFLAESRLRAFLLRREALGSRMIVVLRFVMTDVNAPEADDFRRLWGEFENVELDFQRHLRFPDVDASLDAKARGRVSSGFYEQRQGRRSPVKCLRHWFATGGELGVQVDGAVVPCCLSHNREVVLGNLNDQTLREIWTGEKFARIRRAIFYKEGLNEFPLCERCNFDLA
jgi:radical SAM protein with 4Fe4S-binding SPASM domain